MQLQSSKVSRTKQRIIPRNEDTGNAKRVSNIRKVSEDSLKKHTKRGVNSRNCLDYFSGDSDFLAKSAENMQLAIDFQHAKTQLQLPFSPSQVEFNQRVHSRLEGGESCER